MSVRKFDLKPRWQSRLLSGMFYPMAATRKSWQRNLAEPAMEVRSVGGQVVNLGGFNISLINFQGRFRNAANSINTERRSLIICTLDHLACNVEGNSVQRQ